MLYPPMQYIYVGDVGSGGCVPAIGCVVVATGGIENEGVCDETVPEQT